MEYGGIRKEIQRDTKANNQPINLNIISFFFLFNLNSQIAQSLQFFTTLPQTPSSFLKAFFILLFLLVCLFVVCAWFYIYFIYIFWDGCSNSNKKVIKYGNFFYSAVQSLLAVLWWIGNTIN